LFSPNPISLDCVRQVLIENQNPTLPNTTTIVIKPVKMCQKELSRKEKDNDK